MEFEVKTAGHFYHEKDKDKVNRLMELGIKFEVRPDWHRRYQKIDGAENGKVTINTLEELFAFIDKYGKIILWDDHTITIYDDYLE